MPLLEENQYPEGLLDWYSTQKELVEILRDNPDAEIVGLKDFSLTSGENYWDPCAVQRQITLENMRSNPCDPDGGEGCQDQYTQVNPLLSTNWDEGCGYNDFMPTLTCTQECGRAFVGCVSVAMAQVMRYHSHPQGYNYNNMPNGAGNIHNATLMANIFNTFPSNEQQLYCWGTGISNNNQFGNVMTNSFGYSSAIQGGFNSTTVRSNLNQGRPVILIGTGALSSHMWVTDGYLRTVFCSGQTLLKLHMNWGWGGQGNGLFNFNNWSVTINGSTRSFNNNKQMVYNIIP
jgi:hypothetical protein